MRDFPFFTRSAAERLFAQMQRGGDEVNRRIGEQAPFFFQLIGGVVRRRNGPRASLRTLTARLGKSLAAEGLSAAAGEKPRAVKREQHWLCVSQLYQRLHVRVCFVEAVDVNDIAVASPDFFKLVRSP